MPHEIKLTLDDPALFAEQLKHAASHWDDGRATPIGQALHMAAYQIEEQVKPTVAEPTLTFSVIKAHDKQADDSGLFWVRVLGGWMDDKHGRFRAWQYLDVAEVLRVGIGGPAAKSKETLAAYDEGYGSGQYAGFSQALDSAAGKISTLRAEAITSERKSAYDVVLNLLVEMQP